MLTYIKHRISLKYIIITSATIVFVFSILFSWISRQETQLILEQVKKQAIILHRQIVLTREWVSDHNYILIKKKESEYIESFLNNPEVKDVYGTVYTKITPAMLTRQLSDYAMESSLYSFKLTNINSMNPKNNPDDFEVDAIQGFTSGGINGMSRIEVHDGQKVFRYAAPLVIIKSCLACHDEKQYRVGDIGGCISVFIPFDEAQAAIRKNNFFLFVTMIGLTGSVIIILFLFTRKLIFQPIKEIRMFTRQMRAEELGEGKIEIKGDELKEFAGLCYIIDKKLKNRHKELENKINEATKDFSNTTLNLKQVNKELSLLNTAKTEFFSDISHELRTPLTSIKGAADILSRKCSCNDPVYLDIIKKNTDHLIRTIIDFLDYSKIEAGRLELDIIDESLTGIAKEVIESQKTDAMKKGLKIELEALEDFVFPLDRHRIYQVISNLMSNAIKFSRDRGKIVMHISRMKNTITFSMKDEGQGIKAEHHEHIFKKFYQAPQENGMINIHKGSSGIGLAICKGLVKAHGGDIWVESKKNAGSKFIFILPVEKNNEKKE
jgi:signal transduction histidine kinase